ncbi:MAG TPA: GNAT family N-acetyltransferase [Trebonia sp.]
MDSGITVQDNPESGSYDAALGDQVVGTIVYERRDHRMVIRHTVVDPGFRGQGIAKALAQAALDDLLASGVTLTNYCGFIADFIDRNPRYAQVVDTRQPGRAHPRDAALRDR